MKIVVACLCMVLAIGGGCHPPMRVDYSRFDQQCPAWQELWRRGDRSAQYVAESKGIEAYYEYYMCLEMMYVGQPSAERMQYFFDNAKEFTRIAPDKLRNPRHWKEVYVITKILKRIHFYKYYNVGADRQLLDVWRETIQKKDKYYYDVNYAYYLDVIQSAY